MLRLAHKRDAAAVHALLSTAKSDIPLVDTFDAEPYREWVRHACAKNLVWVVVRNSEIAGAAIIQDCELAYLVVAQDGRRGGIGRRLVKKAKELAGQNELTAKAATDNQPTRRLLESECFRATKTTQGSMVDWIHHVWSRK